jgi:hypothetical protein
MEVRGGEFGTMAGAGLCAAEEVVGVEALIAVGEVERVGTGTGVEDLSDPCL